MYASVLVLMLSSRLPWASPNESTAESSIDILRIGDEKHWLLTFPLDSYFDMHPEAVPIADIRSTAAPRGATSEWELSGDTLFLTDLKVLRFKKGAKEWPLFDTLYLDTFAIPVANESFDTSYGLVSVLAEVFPGMARVSASWFTGYLIIPLGDSTAPCSIFRWRTVYENYLVITVVRGLKNHELSMTDREFCAFWEEQFKNYQQSSEYQIQARRAQARNDSLRAAGSLGMDFTHVALDRDFEKYMARILADSLQQK